ncbi:hypothetical protein K438DRAFT_2019905 [Mycena galopus ATCC 62051]|nr:hypothetical protein K438DRAFT_2019905 [Mycena galopus ATCC 62051]
MYDFITSPDGHMTSPSASLHLSTLGGSCRRRRIAGECSASFLVEAYAFPSFLFHHASAKTNPLRLQLRIPRGILMVDQQPTVPTFPRFPSASLKPPWLALSTSVSAARTQTRAAHAGPWFEFQAHTSVRTSPAPQLSSAAYRLSTSPPYPHHPAMPLPTSPRRYSCSGSADINDTSANRHHFPHKSFFDVVSLHLASLASLIHPSHRPYLDSLTGPLVVPPSPPPLSYTYALCSFLVLHMTSQTLALLPASQH